MHMRYLNLSSTKIEQLPDSIGCLYNLETLLLTNCVHLTSLPKNMKELKNLCCLDITGVPLTKMPPDFGQLQLLWHLTTFVVNQIAGSTLSELGTLSQLQGSLSIVNLHSVVSAIDASKANMMEKLFLEELVLKWRNDLRHQEDNQDMILDRLQPNRNLKRLRIEDYHAQTFPCWLGDPSFSNIVSIHLVGCINCVTLPPLGQLSSLKTLLIANMKDLERVGPEFYGNSDSRFRALEILIFQGMSKWKEWQPDDREEFPSLRELHIRDCPELAEILLQRLDSLEKLVISGCNALLNLFPKVPKLREFELSNCGALVSLHEETMQGNTHLKKVTICNCSSLQSILTLGLSPSLESLHISKCGNLELFPADFAPYHYQEVKLLHLKNSRNNLSCFQLSAFKKLCALYIEDCASLESLWISDEFDDELSHLLEIQLKECPRLVSFPDGGLRAPNLGVLEICNCENLTPQVGWGLHEMSSFGYFKIEGKLEGFESFPPTHVLPACLTDLHIIGFENLKPLSLNHAAIQPLVSLQHLVIDRCNVIEFLPEDGLPSSSSNLGITCCPLLVPRCEPDTGDYWPLIAHISNKDIG